MTTLLVGVAVGSVGTALLLHTSSGRGPAQPVRPAAASRALEEVDGSDLYDGVHSLLREWKCGHGNMETPRTVTVGGFGQVIVDIGLGEDAKETIDAVKKGFVVFGFEPMPENYRKVRHRWQNATIGSQLRFIELTERGGHWDSTLLQRKPLLGVDRGFAYIIQAAVGDTDSIVKLPTRGNNGALGTMTSGGRGTGLVPVPQVRLDTVLPAWASAIHLMKIDTQGYELKVLMGALDSLRALRFRYVLYEFSPWLMKQGNLGEPMELLRLLPGMKALCFDMYGNHNLFPRPSRPLSRYYTHLLSGNHSYMYDNQLPPSGVVPGAPLVGPWDDILCWFPHAAERAAPLDQGGPFGSKKYDEPGSFAEREQVAKWPRGQVAKRPRGQEAKWPTWWPSGQEGQVAKRRRQSVATPVGSRTSSNKV